MISEGNFNIIVFIWIGIGLALFPILLKVTAPYGRHSKNNWGPMINNRLGWIIMELPALLLVVFFVLKGRKLQELVILVAFILWVSHYLNRSLIYPLRIKTKNKKMPLAIMMMAFFFNLVNGFLIGYWMGVLSSPYPEGWFFDIRFILGLLFFITGYSINQYHDHLLIKLRQQAGTSYKMPQGGLFKFISCPNFFGEIIEWGGFALLTWSFPALSFFLWTVINLLPRALDHHKWYKEKFNDYPPTLKAIIPFFI